MISNNEIMEKLVKLTNWKFISNTKVKTTFELKIDISDMIEEFNYTPIKKIVLLEKTFVNLSK